VEQADRLQFVPGFQFRPDHAELDGQGHHQQQVVARDTGDAGARHEQHGGHEGEHEQAGARLLDAEIPEFECAAAQAGQLARAVVEQEVVERGKHGGRVGGRLRKTRLDGRAPTPV